MHKMDIHFKVFCVLMLDKITWKVNNTNIVIVDKRDFDDRTLEF